MGFHGFDGGSCFRVSILFELLGLYGEVPRGSDGPVLCPSKRRASPTSDTKTGLKHLKTVS